MRWFRMYSEIIDDPKIARMTDNQFRIFTYLLAVASEWEREGLIPFSLGDISWRIRRSQDEISDTLRYLQESNIASWNDDGVAFVNWKKRQFRSDNVSERTKRFKERSGARSLGHPSERSPELHQSRADTESEQSRAKDRLVDNLPEQAFLKEPDDNRAAEIKALLLKISNLKPDAAYYQEVALFIQSSIPRVQRGEIHQDALIRALTRLAEELGRGENIAHPRGFLQAIMEAENGRYQAREEEAKKERLQPSRAEATQALEHIKSIFKRL